MIRIKTYLKNNIFIAGLLCLICLYGNMNKASCSVSSCNMFSFYEMYSDAVDTSNKFKISYLIRSKNENFDGFFDITFRDTNTRIVICEDDDYTIKKIVLIPAIKKSSDENNFSDTMIWIFNTMGISMEAWCEAKEKSNEEGTLRIRNVWCSKIKKYLKISYVDTMSNNDRVIVVMIENVD